MDKNEYYNDAEFEEDEEDGLDIDWIGMASKLLGKWKFILAVTFLFAVVGVGTALLMKKKYTVSVVLAPEVQGKTSGSVGGIASMLGLGGASIGNSSDALNITLFPEICYSTPFLVQLFDVEVTPYVSPKSLFEGVPIPKAITLFKYITKEDEPKKWYVQLKELILGEPFEYDPDTLNISQLSPKQRLVIKELREGVNATVDKKTGITSIRVTMDDPWIATTLADTICQRLQNYVISYRTQKASEDLAYYEKLAADAKEKMVKAQAAYALSVDYNRSVILQSINTEKDRLKQEAQIASEIYGQTEQQVQLAKAKLQEMKPVFAVVQPASMPIRPSSISKKLIVFGFMCIGGLLGCGWILFGEEFWLNIRKQNAIHPEEQAEN